MTSNFVRHTRIGRLVIETAGQHTDADIAAELRSVARQLLRRRAAGLIREFEDLVLADPEVAAILAERTALAEQLFHKKAYVEGQPLEIWRWRARAGTLSDQPHLPERFNEWLSARDLNKEEQEEIRLAFDEQMTMYQTWQFHLSLMQNLPAREP